MAALVVMVQDPWAAVSAGFWLSFGAVASILFAMQGAVGRVHGWRAHLAQAARVQWTVTLGLVPASVVLFQQVSLVSPVANAVAIPAVSVLIAPAALAGAALLGLPSPADQIGRWVLELDEKCFGWLAAALGALVELPGSSLGVPATPGWTVVLAALGLLWCVAPPGWPLRALGLSGLLPLFAWPAPAPRPGELWVTALDVGQGMSLVVETAGHALLFDTGPSYSADADAGARIVLPYLQWRGLVHLDALVVSHQDNDHSGGAGAVLRGLPVATVISSVPARNAMFAAGPPARLCVAGQRYAWGDLQLEVLQPEAASYGRKLTTNQRSCVVLVTAGSRRVLLTGDVPVREERAMVARGAVPEVDLMVAPHHGSHTSSSEELLRAAAPRWASIQVAYRSRFGHPHPEVLARYAAHGITVLRSDRDGAVQWRFGRGRGDPNRARDQVEAWRIEHAHYWHDQGPGTSPLQSGDEADEAGTDAEAAPPADWLGAP